MLLPVWQCQSTKDAAASVAVPEFSMKDDAASVAVPEYKGCTEDAAASMAVPEYKGCCCHAVSLAVPVATWVFSQLWG